MSSGCRLHFYRLDKMYIAMNKILLTMYNVHILYEFPLENGVVLHLNKISSQLPSGMFCAKSDWNSPSQSWRDWLINWIVFFTVSGIKHYPINQSFRKKHWAKKRVTYWQLIFTSISPCKRMWPFIRRNEILIT